MALDASLVADEHARYVDANPQACALTGYSREELLGMTLMDLTPPNEREAGREDVRAAQAGSGRMRGEYRLLRKDRRRLDVEFSAVRVGPGRYQTVLRDITQRKQDEGGTGAPARRRTSGAC